MVPALRDLAHSITAAAARQPETERVKFRSDELTRAIPCARWLDLCAVASLPTNPRRHSEHGDLCWLRRVSVAKRILGSPAGGRPHMPMSGVAELALQDGTTA